jgi:3-oxoacyl-[acyl-carrier-protein] synthase I
MRRLPITGIGLVTALGDGAAGSCAALRAGLSAFGEAAVAEVDDGEGGTAPVTACPTDYADGFFQTGAWVRLAGGALEDLLHRNEGLGRAAGRSAFASAAPILDEERLAWTSDELPGPLEPHYAAPLRSSHAIDAPPDLRFASAAGHCGLAELVLACEPLLARGAERVFLAAADSYLDPLALDWLARAGRLKGASRPTGLVPGEAGAAILVEAEPAARRRRASVLGFVEAAALAAAPPSAAEPARAPDDDEDVPSPKPEGPKLGRALDEAVRQVLPPGEARFAGDLYLDLNGEEWRARGWGHAQVHLVRRVDFDRCRTFLPATSIGDVGAAAAPVALSLALWSFDRDGTRDALVVSMADDGRVAAIRLSAPTAGPAAAPRAS